MNEELIINLWAVYDSMTGVVYGLSGKAYNVSGTDESKLALLKSLSATDYLTSKRYELPSRFKINNTDGSIKEKVTFLNAVYDPNSQLFEDVYKNIEAELPPLPDFSGEVYAENKQKVPENPLCVTTVLYETENGYIRPIVTDEDRQWIAEYEKKMQNT